MKNYKFKRWILLFSHSGSEAATLVQGLHEEGAMDIDIWTNNKKTEQWQNNWPVVENEIAEFDEYSYSPRLLPVEEINRALSEIDVDTVVTLHGYNRILPPEVVKNPHLEIYNLHPGDVLAFPELIGKDPQEKALELKLPFTAVILHAVTEAVDSGPIHGYLRYEIEYGTELVELINDLKAEALNLWFPFLLRKLNK